MAHEVLRLRIPPAMKQWLEAEVQRRKAAGERTVNMTVIVMEALEQVKKGRA